MSTTPAPARRLRRGLAVAALGLGAALVVPVALPATAAPLTTDPAQAADLAATWLVGRVDPAGLVPGPTDAPDPSATLEVALALAASRSQEATFDLILDWLQDNPETVIVNNGADDPARLGYLLMLARTAEIDPHAFGGVDLETRLAGTLGASEPGLYGGADPTFDGAFRQSIALAGLVAVGATPPAAAVTWLVDQQCDAPATAAGGYLGYRADTTVDCPEPDPIGFTGPDTNSTALAAQALVATGQASAADAALDFLAAAQDADGGFGYIGGAASDPNSDALAIQAIVAAGESPTAGRWDKGTDDAMTALLSWQVGTEGAAADQGAFAASFAPGLADLYATRQAVWGAALAPFPFLFVAFPQVVPTTSTTAGGNSTTAAPTTTRVVPVVNPTFTG